MASRRTRIKGIANIPQRKKPTQSQDKNSIFTTEEDPQFSNNVEVENKNDSGDPKSIETLNNDNTNSKSPVRSVSPNNTNLQTTRDNAKSNLKQESPIINDTEMRGELEFFNKEDTDNSPTITNTNEQHIPKTASEKPINNMNRRQFLRPDININVVKTRQPIKDTGGENSGREESDSEYPAPPPSPSKINRSRIKAVPRLNQRKTSFSASESEDESRKYSRIRNNSVCSVASTTNLEPPSSTSESMPPKEVIPILQKKINRSDQSRKLAEARREFQKRFGFQDPDKQKLRMIDLIFYNPTTNPMSQKDNKEKKSSTEVTNDKEKSINSESDVSTNETENKEKENTDDSMPVPQIKIGPTGEIILDEQSLVVENAEVARKKQELQNSKLINGDFDTGYGIYKRKARARAWSQKETLGFYKALSLIGTDFTVMAQLFPKRSRAELKTKFKKEEKINMQLVNKAIMQPCNYNFADLKRELELERKEEEAVKKILEEEILAEKRMRQEKRRYGKKPTSSNSSKENLNEDSQHSDSSNTTQSNRRSLDDADSQDSLSNLPPKKRLKGINKKTTKTEEAKKRKTKPLNITSILEDDSDADISDMETQSESEEEETIPFLAPTRSGRMPKSTPRYITPYEAPKMLPNRVRQRKSSSVSVSSIESNPERLVPGSVVVTNDVENGKNVYKVFMVTPQKKLTPLDLDSETIEKLVKARKNDDQDDCIISLPEENITIPAIGEAIEEQQSSKNNS